jgi:Holliday junction resolvase RusA-like endonuclease
MSSAEVVALRQVQDAFPDRSADVADPVVRSIVVRADPVPKARPRFGRGRTYTPRSTERAEWQIRQAWIEAHGDVPAQGAVCVRIEFMVAQPVSIPKCRRLTALPSKRPDADNLAKTVLDALSGVSYRDDGQIVDLHVRKRYAVGAAPCSIVEVEELV